MKILFAASEAVPFAKTGGLADVIGSLPGELNNLGADVRVIMPKYGDIPLKYKDKMVLKKNLTIFMGWEYFKTDIYELEFDSTTFYFVESEKYFNRSGIYGFGDEVERFTFFAHAVLEALPHLGFKPQILHCHDWHAGPISLFLKTHYKDNEYYKDIRTVYTIHNLSYQGIFPTEVLRVLFNLGDEYFTHESIEFYGQGSFMKAGLVYSDYITTVSKTYAQEIQTPYYGERLDGLLRHRKDVLVGILNGIDCKLYNPRTDKNIFYKYKDSLIKKQKNKLKLQQLLGLPRKAETPMIALVSRLVEQKGLDLVIQILDEVLAMDVQFIVLGTGQKQYEQHLYNVSKAYPDKMYAQFVFDDSLARKIWAGSDLFMMPSRFEPCGLCQLIALRYGSIPIVRETGGLKDTVKQFNPQTGEGNGFTFSSYDPRDLLNVTKKAVELYKDKKSWQLVSKNAMASDFCWRKSANEYLNLYNQLVNK